MIAPVSNAFPALVQSLETQVPGVTTELTQFPSGAIMLDVRRSDGRAFVLDFTPAHGYTVDEVGPAEVWVAPIQSTCTLRNVADHDRASGAKPCLPRTWVQRLWNANVSAPATVKDAAMWTLPAPVPCCTLSQERSFMVV